MTRVSAIAIYGAVLATTSVAHAQTVTERLRLQGAYLTEQRPSPQPRTKDVFVSAVPELSVVFDSPGSQIGLTYSLTGALHSLGGASEIAHRLSLQGSFPISRRTTLVLSAVGAQTSLSNLLVSQPANGSTIGVLPGVGSRLITGLVTEALVHDLTPRVRFDEELAANVTTTLAPSVPLDTFFFGGALGLEHLWPNDAVGAEVRSLYAIVRTIPPAVDQQFVTASAGPRWRHDWSRTLSSSVTAGAAVVVSPDSDTRTRVAPSARGSLLYAVRDSSVELSASTGIVPSPVSGQVGETRQGRLYGTTPLSTSAQVYVSASIGYARTTLLDLTPAKNELRYDAVFSDVELTWAPTSLARLFARYQFMAQIGETSDLGVNPSFLRDQVLVGVQFSSRPPPIARGGGGSVTSEEVDARLPRRVDQSDAPIPAPLSPAVETPPQSGETDATR